MGVDIALLLWCGLFGPSDMPAEAAKYWEQTIGKLMKTEAWKKAQDRHLWFDADADSATLPDHPSNRRSNTSRISWRPIQQARSMQ